jgi:hypothetical protein
VEGVSDRIGNCREYMIWEGGVVGEGGEVGLGLTGWTGMLIGVMLTVRRREMGEAVLESAAVVELRRDEGVRTTDTVAARGRLPRMNLVRSPTESTAIGRGGEVLNTGV